MPDEAPQRTVVINDLATFRQRSGVAFYVVEMLRSLPEIDPELRIVPLSQTLAGRPLKAASRAYESGRKASSGDLGRSPLRMLLGRVTKLAKGVGHVALDKYLGIASRLSRWPLFHEPDSLPLRVSSPTVTTVQDLSVLLHPEWHPAHRVAKYERRLMEGVAQTREFVTSAESTRRDMVRLLGIAADRIHVVPLAPRPQFRELPPEAVGEARSHLDLPPRFVLYIGTIEPRKNVAGLLRAYAMIRPELRNSVPLLLAGGWGWRSEAIRDQLSRSPWSECVRWLGYLSDEDLVAVANAAELVVYPSFYEGFGLPPVEAMACGRPVVTTHAGSLAEVVGDAARIVDPHDDEELAQAITELLENPELAGEFQRRGRERVLRFDWKETARKTAAVYRRAA